MAKSFKLYLLAHHHRHHHNWLWCFFFLSLTDPLSLSLDFAQTQTQMPQAPRLNRCFALSLWLRSMSFPLGGCLYLRLVSLPPRFLFLLTLPCFLPSPQPSIVLIWVQKEAEIGVVVIVKQKSVVVVDGCEAVVGWVRLWVVG